MDKKGNLFITKKQFKVTKIKIQDKKWIELKTILKEIIKSPFSSKSDLFGEFKYYASELKTIKWIQSEMKRIEKED